MSRNIKELSYYYYNESIKLLKNKELSKANELLKKARSIYEDDIDILNLHGIVLLRLNYMSGSKKTFEKSLNISNTTNNIAHEYLEFFNSSDFVIFSENYNRAIANMRNSKYDLAIKCINKCLDINDEVIDLYILKGLCIYRKKEFKKSIQVIDEAYKLDKNNKDLNAYTVMFQKQYKKDMKSNLIAIGILTILLLGTLIICYKIITINDKLNNENRNLALSIEELKKSATNSKEEESIDLLNYSELEIRDMAFKAYSDNNNEEARLLFKEIYNRSAEITLVEEACFYLAIINEEIANGEEALEYYHSYIEKYNYGNYYGEALYNAAILALKLDKIDLAKEYAKSILNDIPDSIYANDKIYYINRL